ncbi:MAG TPA: CDP-diacylglycerol--serine O-phosphatidyltransferase [Dysgonamonadaceae bacterium]|nr:CDP-diacylglycerol--serine O-phosphatidyltransferase [Dysgonamonadaceae bacterium]
MKKHVPNTITSMNLFSGCIAIVMAFEGAFIWVVFWVILAAIFDFFDGMAARLLNAYSDIGKELDSLADVVSFGVAPAVVLFILLRDYTFYSESLIFIQPYIPYLAFIIPVFSALRLAKFNIDERQTSSFIGLPTPANALFWISYVYGIHKSSMANTAILFLTMGLIVALSLLMVSEAPMFSFKFKNMKIKGNEKPLILIICAAVFVSVWGVVGLAWTVIAYIVISLTSILLNKKAVK